MLIERQCLTCGTWFEASRSHARFCSTRCRSAFHNLKNKKRLNVSDNTGDVLAQLIKNTEDIGLLNDQLIKMIVQLLDNAGVPFPSDISQLLK